MNDSILDNLQNSLLNEQEKEKYKKKNVIQYNFDKLRMYFGKDYEINGIKISIPTIGDILDIGEKRFFQSASIFLYNSTSIRVFLWDNFNKLDWNKVKDIEVFAIMSKLIQDKEPLKLFFKDVSFDDFEIVQAKENIEDTEFVPALYSKSQDILLYEKDYIEIAEYIRTVLDIHPKREKAVGSAVSWIIQEDKMNIAQRKKTEESFTLLPLVSACVNHPGFKYKSNELKEVGIYQFMDSVRRIQKYENSTAALKGIYSGFVSVKDIDENVLNFMGDL